MQTVNNTLGAAAGTVITYSLSDDDVLTIKSVLGLNKLKNDGEFTAVDGNQKPSVGTGDIAYIEKNAAAETGMSTAMILPLPQPPVHAEGPLRERRRLPVRDR